MITVTADEWRARARRFDVACAAVEDIDVPDGTFDHTITDPPYLPRTQDNTRRGRMTRNGISEAMPLGFASLTDTKRERWAAKIAAATRRWAIIFSDHEGSMLWVDELERFGMVHARSGIWVRTGDDDLDNVVGHPTQSGAPQFTGDRPGTGHEVLVIMHAGDARMRWNGHGKPAVYVAPVVPSIRRAHPTEKPLELVREIVADFVVPGETVFDPFAGAGTVAVACKLRGAFCAGVEISQKFATYAARRAAAASPFTEAASETT